MKYQIERNHAGKTIGISCQDAAKHDLDFICTLTDKETARRIVACLNACEGLSTEGLELMPSFAKHTIERVAQLKAQNAGLVEALTQIRDHMDMEGYGHEAWKNLALEMAEVARTAIAEAEK